MRVLIFGDSITQGFYDEQGGWATRLVNYYMAQDVAKRENVPTLFNLGISGDTTDMLLRRFQPETEARKFPGEGFAFLFNIGTNDTVYRGEDNESEPEVYKQQLSELVKQAREYSEKILFVSLFPVIDELVQPFPWSTTGKYYSTERMKLFNDALIEFCRDNNSLLVNLWSIFANEPDLDSLFFDGIHPNAKGHQLIYETIKPQLEELLK